MRRCSKCGDEMADPPDTCRVCGAPIDAVDAMAFPPELPVMATIVESPFRAEAAQTARRRAPAVRHRHDDDPRDRVRRAFRHHENVQRSPSRLRGHFAIHRRRCGMSVAVVQGEEAAVGVVRRRNHHVWFHRRRRGGGGVYHQPRLFRLGR